MCAQRTQEPSYSACSCHCDYGQLPDFRTALLSADYANARRTCHPFNRAGHFFFPGLLRPLNCNFRFLQ